MELNIKFDEKLIVETANRVLDEFDYNGKTIREWADSLTHPKTNADRFRSMSDEQMAEWLAEVLFHCSNTICDQRCPMYECCCDQPSDNIEDWLKQEASET